MKRLQRNKVSHPEMSLNLELFLDCQDEPLSTAQEASYVVAQQIYNRDVLQLQYYQSQNALIMESDDDTSVLQSIRTQMGAPKTLSRVAQVLPQHGLNTPAARQKTAASKPTATSVQTKITTPSQAKLNAKSSQMKIAPAPAVSKTIAEPTNVPARTSRSTRTAAKEAQKFISSFASNSLKVYEDDVDDIVVLDDDKPYRAKIKGMKSSEAGGMKQTPAHPATEQNVTRETASQASDSKRGRPRTIGSDQQNTPTTVHIQSKLPQKASSTIPALVEEIKNEKPKAAVTPKAAVSTKKTNIPADNAVKTSQSTPLPTPKTGITPKSGVSAKKTTAPGRKMCGQFLVPLKEYYYARRGSQLTYRESKGQFKFKCWYCHKMLYNNVRLMIHLQGHLDSERQQNLDLSDITQCKHCFRQFDTPFEMQGHVDRVHQNNPDVLLCRICEKDVPNQLALHNHMRMSHTVHEMPYVCQLCNFCSSVYSDVVDHFKSRHDSSQYILCLYCLKVLQIKFHNTGGFGLTLPYYQHLLKHQAKGNNKKCGNCKLMFLSAVELKSHKQNHHAPNNTASISGRGDYTTIGDQVPVPVVTYDCGPLRLGKAQCEDGQCVVQDVDIKLPVEDNYECKECAYNFGQETHICKLAECFLCGYTTMCSFAWDNHTTAFHSGKAENIAKVIPAERDLDQEWHCSCGFQTARGNRLANHLVMCSKRTAYSDLPQPKFFEYDAEHEEFHFDSSDGEDETKEDSSGTPKLDTDTLFGALGLIPRTNSKLELSSKPAQKVATEVIGEVLDKMFPVSELIEMDVQNVPLSDSAGLETGKPDVITECSPNEKLAANDETELVVKAYDDVEEEDEDEIILIPSPRFDLTSLGQVKEAKEELIDAAMEVESHNVTSHGEETEAPKTADPVMSTDSMMYVTADIAPELSMTDAGDSEGILQVQRDENAQSLMESPTEDAPVVGLEEADCSEAAVQHEDLPKTTTIQPDHEIRGRVVAAGGVEDEGVEAGQVVGCTSGTVDSSDNDAAFESTYLPGDISQWTDEQLFGPTGEDSRPITKVSSTVSGTSTQQSSVGTAGVDVSSKQDVQAQSSQQASERSSHRDSTQDRSRGRSGSRSRDRERSRDRRHRYSQDRIERTSRDQSRDRHSRRDPYRYRGRDKDSRSRSRSRSRSKNRSRSRNRSRQRSRSRDRYRRDRSRSRDKKGYR